MSPTAFLLVALLAICSSAGVSARAGNGKFPFYWQRDTAVCNEDAELTTKCSDDCKSVQLCTISDSGDYHWLTYRACAVGQACEGNKCVDESASDCLDNLCNEELEFTTKCTKDCKTVELCRADNSGNYYWADYKQCEEGTACQGTACVNQELSDCYEKSNKITCLEAGLYPHPRDCRRYFVCDENGDQELRTCENPNFMFSACTESCDWQYSEEECANTAINCNSLGNGALEAVYSNRRLYFTCKTDSDGMYPEFARCDPGKIFDDKTHQCEKHSSPGCGIVKKDT